MNSEVRNKTLYFFTSTYPFGNSPLWKKNELEVLRNYFRKVIVVPRTDDGVSEARNMVEGVEYRSPIINAEHARTDRKLTEKIRIMLRLLRPPMLSHFLAEFFTPSVLFKPQRLKELLRASYEIALFQGNASVEDLFKDLDRENTIFYFYWGIGQINALLLKRRADLPFTACRFLGFDLYKERHPAKYIPYRKWLINTIDLLMPCSDDGADYLTAQGALRDRIFVARLGTKSYGRSKIKADNLMKIVTCSNVVEVKRLDLLCEALLHTTVPIRWTHMGDGELMPTIREYVERFPPNVDARLLGAVPPSEVPTILINESFDLFVNTSSSEGVPVSIMEAFAAGIPVLATNVGGTGEIVDDTVGKLMPSSVTASELARLIEGFSCLDEATSLEMRDNAFRRFQEKCDVTTNAEALANVLVNEGRIDI
jgi:glycosyltransferase involved in cell wall biosynthesis